MNKIQPLEPIRLAEALNKCTDITDTWDQRFLRLPQGLEDKKITSIYHVEDALIKLLDELDSDEDLDFFQFRIMVDGEEGEQIDYYDTLNYRTFSEIETAWDNCQTVIIYLWGSQ